MINYGDNDMLKTDMTVIWFLYLFAENLLR
jgi:hypothetical protein